MKTLIHHDVIEPFESPTASPVVVVKQHGKYLFCVDFRKLNDFTPPIRYPLPRPDSIFNALSGKRFFTTMDANKGYHQFAIDKESRHLIAFVTESQGLWQYKRVPFGLKNAPSFFQAAMDAILGSMRWDFVLAYIDDLIIYSNTFESHLLHLESVLEAVQKVGMTLDEQKCFFAYENLSLLGHRIFWLGLMTQPEKVKAIQSMQFPTTVRGLQTVLGQFTYYRQFIPKFALVAQTLFEAMKLVERLTDESPKERARRHGRQPITATPACLEAFTTLKRLLCEVPVLRHPNFEQSFFLHTDSCKHGLAATLEQEFDGKKHPILFISRSLKDEESRYTATEIECLAVYWALHKLTPYVEGSKLTLITDHSALKWIWAINPATNSRLYRWSLLLGPLKDAVTIVHRAGRLHSNVDPISGHPLPETYFVTEAAETANLTTAMDPRRRGTSTFHATEISAIATDVFRTLYVQEMEKEKDQDEKLHLTPFDGLQFREKDRIFQLYVPGGLRDEILAYCHNHSGHPGIVRTWIVVKSMFWWKGVKKETEAYVKSCHHCQMEKARHVKPPGSLQLILSPMEPFHTISIDFVDELPLVRGRNRLATVTCKATKAVIFLALPKECGGAAFADIFLESVYPRWGMPAKIISDRDSRFTSNFWKHLTAMLHIQLGFSTASHPQADGQSERTNRTLELMIRIFVFELQHRNENVTMRDWVRLLLILEFEHNLTVNVSTGFALFDLLHAARPRRPLEQALLQKKRDEAPHKDAWTLVNEVEARRKIARMAIRRSQAHQKKYYDLKRSPVPEFAVGEKVVLLPYDKRGKLDPHGRCVRIKQRISPLAYRISRPIDAPRMHDVVSIDYLRKYYRRGRAPDDPVTADPSEDEGGLETAGIKEVKEVIGERKLGPGFEKEYLVRWKDFREDDITWVKASEMDSAAKAVKEWHDAQVE